MLCDALGIYYTAFGLLPELDGLKQCYELSFCHHLKLPSGLLPELDGLKQSFNCHRLVTQKTAFGLLPELDGLKLVKQYSGRYFKCGLRATSRIRWIETLSRLAYPRILFPAFGLLPELDGLKRHGNVYPLIAQFGPSGYFQN